MVIHNIPTWINLAYIGGAGAVAIIRGGPPERVLGLLLALMLVNGTPGSPLGWPLWTVDLACFVASVYATTRLRRRWPIVASAAFLLCLATKVIYVLDPSLHFWSFLSVELACTYLGATAILWGALTRRRNLAEP